MIKIILLFIIPALLLLSAFNLNLNEEQQGIWNHFWNIRSRELRITEETNQQAFLKSYKIKHPAYNNLVGYKLKKRPLPGPYGETQFDFVPDIAP